MVPFGGGTSVVGGLAGERGRFSSLVSLDLGRLDRVVSIDPRSLVAVFEPGIRLPEADAALRAQGLALGHVPQSYEWATVGGCAATRSAGQTSTGHGRIDEQVVALSCVTPSGALSTLDAPGSAAGPSLRELVLGSEGTLGVITSVALRVRRRVEASYDAWSVESFMAGADLLRALEQDGIAPDIARLSDEQETRTSLALAGTGTVGRRLLGGRCLLVCGWQGATGRATAARKLIRGGALPLGPVARARVGEVPLRRAAPARRPAGPRRAGRDAGDGDDVVEPGAALPRGAGARCPGCTSGATSRTCIRRARRCTSPCSARSPTIRSRSGGRSRRRHAGRSWTTAARSPTTTRWGATTPPYLPDEVGELGVELLRAVKIRCDPAGVMNPGKLLPG